MFSPLANPSATTEVLTRHGLFTKKRLGQNFLIDDNVIGRILALAAVEPDAVVLEVGPGIGTLTVALVATGARVVSVEFDSRLPEVLADTVGTPDTFALVTGDAARIAPAALAAPFGAAPTALVSNLPYQVAATVVLRFFEEIPTLCSATVMVQAEVADRMAARPGAKAYSGYTVKLGLLAEPVGRFAVSRGSFLPQPHVDSAVIRLERRVGAAASKTYRSTARIVDAAFAQRRKTIANSLRHAWDFPARCVPEIRSDLVEQALRAAGIDPRARAETLEIAAFTTLQKEFQVLDLI